ncbi:hypothetical protein STCU_10765 [Strigomonas culicis]|uniref:Uncharacterized protein n=1 Tax=Strigomonas culicis TaxID=28005 RepID=S9TGM5_9TRYP|nr:hypothetical protein STCU_10765 [Strigomonas culicis]|eukprot:EPY17187.1 hypothetical protein STCU_10765 [Strigomonas culicis]
MYCTPTPPVVPSLPRFCRRDGDDSASELASQAAAPPTAPHGATGRFLVECRSLPSFQASCSFFEAAAREDDERVLTGRLFYHRCSSAIQMRESGLTNDRSTSSGAATLPQLAEGPAPPPRPPDDASVNVILSPWEGAPRRSAPSPVSFFSDEILTQAAQWATGATSGDRQPVELASVTATQPATEDAEFFSLRQNEACERSVGTADSDFYYLDMPAYEQQSMTGTVLLTPASSSLPLLPQGARTVATGSKYKKGQAKPEYYYKPLPQRRSDSPSYMKPSSRRHSLVCFTESTEFVHAFHNRKSY